MSLRSGAFLLVLCFALLAWPAAAQEEDEGKDHPRIPRITGYYISSSTETDFDAFEFNVGEAGTKSVEGRAWRIDYRLKEGVKLISPLEIARNYLNQVRAKGGKSLHQSLDSNGGEATMVMPGQDGGEVWIGLSIANSGAAYALSVIETAAMKQRIEFSASQMAEQLANSGRVALRGILFDTGKATIKPESAELLDEVAKLLKEDVSLQLLIEGHTDNVGQKATNLELSKRRAAAVQAALVSRGIAAERLMTQGFGDTKPVADNAAEEGRAKNRRVELVKK